MPTGTLEGDRQTDDIVAAVGVTDLMFPVSDQDQLQVAYSRGCACTCSLCMFK